LSIDIPDKTAARKKERRAHPHHDDDCASIPGPLDQKIIGTFASHFTHEYRREKLFNLFEKNQPRGS
jgi:hypothetical protein